MYIQYTEIVQIIAACIDFSLPSFSPYNIKDENLVFHFHVYVDGKLPCIFIFLEWGDQHVNT